MLTSCCLLSYLFLKKCLLYFLLLVMLFAHVEKRPNSRSQMFFRTGGFKHFAMFIGKNLYWSHFLIKIQYWTHAFLFKKRLQHRCFYVNIAKFLKTAFSYKTCSLYLSEILLTDKIIDNWYFRVKLYYCKLRFYKDL